MANSIQTAIQKLRAGEIVGLPTETVYGLAVDAYNESAVKSLHMLKGRPDGKPFQVMVQSVEEAAKLVKFDARAKKLAKAFWPGPLTIVLTSLSGEGTIGIRIPDHDIMQEILEIFDSPLIISSANRSGQPSANDAEEAEAIFGHQVSCYVEGAAGKGRASTVVDATGKTLKILREGTVTLKALEKAALS